MSKQIPIERSDYKFLAQNLSKVRFFQGLAMRDLDDILEQVALYEFDSGRYVFREGDAADGLYIVYTGGVRITRKRVFPLPAKTVGRLGPGGLFGEMAILDNHPRSASVKTVEPSKIFVLLRSAVDGIIRRNPAFAAHMQAVSDQRAFENRHAS